MLILIHLRTSDDYLGKGFKNKSQIMFEGLISCLGGKRLEDKHKIKGINSNYNQILANQSFIYYKTLFIFNV